MRTIFQTSLFMSINALTRFVIFATLIKLLYQGQIVLLAKLIMNLIPLLYVNQYMISQTILAQLEVKQSLQL